MVRLLWKNTVITTNRGIDKSEINSSNALWLVKGGRLYLRCGEAAEEKRSEEAKVTMKEPSVFYQRGEVILAFLNAFKYFSGISFINVDVKIKTFLNG